MLNTRAGLKAKETGMQLALDYAGDEWKTRALNELRAWCADQLASGIAEMTMEDFRAVAKNVPSRHHAWGPLAVAACKAKILALRTHPDGSPITRRAASPRTHAHRVNLYRILPVSFASSPAEDTKCPSPQDNVPAQAQRQPSGIDARGAVLHSGSGAMSALEAYNRGRAEVMGEQG